MLELDFSPTAGAVGVSSISFGDLPIRRQIVSAAAEELDARYSDGDLTVIDPPQVELVQAADRSLLEFAIMGQVGDKYDVEVSEDLVHWVPVLTLVNATGTVRHSEKIQPKTQARFYRVVVQP